MLQRVFLSSPCIYWVFCGLFCAGVYALDKGVPTADHSAAAILATVAVLERRFSQFSL